MVIEHSMKNIGTKPIRSNMYNHNFLTLDNQPPGPDFTITFPFELKPRRAPNKELGEVRGNQILYVKTLQDKDRMTTRSEERRVGKECRSRRSADRERKRT